MPAQPQSPPKTVRTVRQGSYLERMIEDPQGEMQRVRVHIGESPLLWLRVRGYLSERLYLAGDRLREDWEKAGLGARVTMAWDAAPASGGTRSAPRAPDPHMRQIVAKDRFHAALQCAGPGLADILWRVVCAGEGLSAAEQALGWPTRAGKLVLTFALERVAGYYRIA
tara:strand:+ start:2041 stop:2544 length:504 start_codon:yes stop_codon:yes gene_type:complete